MTLLHSAISQKVGFRARLFGALFFAGVLSVTTSFAGTIINTGQSVTGSTKILSLDASKVEHPSDKVILSNSGGNLVVSLASNASSGDFHLTWQGATDGLNFNTSSYKYVQISISAISSGMTHSDWEMSWQDDDSTVGGANNSGHVLGKVNPVAAPFSVIIDLTNGGTKVSGAKGWGPGTLDIFRFNPF